MSFFAANDRIFITNTDGKIIFDTDKPMPHIFQRVQAVANVVFPSISGSYRQEIFTGQPTPACRQYDRVYVCANRYSCQLEQVCGFRNGMYQCWTENVCANRYSCEWEWQWVNYPQHQVSKGFDYNALEWQQTVELADITDGIEADFILVNATAQRTVQGQIIDAGPIPCGLPLGPNFMANNSSIVETVSDVSNGQPWMTRIMSVFVEGGKIKVHFKHSNRAFNSKSTWSEPYCNYSSVPSYPAGMPSSLPSSRSDFNFTFDIHVGKFTL